MNQICYRYAESAHREKLEVDRDVYVCFVDYEKAFDRVDWEKLMRRLGVDYRDRRLIGNLYMGQKITVRIEEKDSDPGIIGRETRQGCPLSPLLFSIYIQEVLNETLDNVAAVSYTHLTLPTILRV